MHTSNVLGVSCRFPPILLSWNNRAEAAVPTVKTIEVRVDRRGERRWIDQTEGDELNISTNQTDQTHNYPSQLTTQADKRHWRSFTSYDALEVITKSDRVHTTYTPRYRLTTKQQKSSRWTIKLLFGPHTPRPREHETWDSNQGPTSTHYGLERRRSVERYSILHSRINFWVVQLQENTVVRGVNNGRGQTWRPDSQSQVRPKITVPINNTYPGYIKKFGRMDDVNVLYPCTGYLDNDQNFLPRYPVMKVQTGLLWIDKNPSGGMNTVDSSFTKIDHSPSLDTI